MQMSIYTYNLYRMLCNCSITVQQLSVIKVVMMVRSWLYPFAAASLNGQRCFQLLISSVTPDTTRAGAILTIGMFPFVPFLCCLLLKFLLPFALALVKLFVWCGQ